MTQPSTKPTPSRPHIVCVGFHAGEADAFDFEGCAVTAVMPRRSADRLPADLAGRFARIAVFDLDDSSGADLDAYDRVYEHIRDLVRSLVARFGAPVGVVGLYEHTTLPAARLREDFGVPGTDVRTATLCRDKVRMKQVLGAAGVTVPRYLAVGPQTPVGELGRFASALPGRIVLKPRSQGASFGVRILDGSAELLRLAQDGGIAAGYEAEEFVEGTICHFDGVVRDGAIRWFSASKYLDSCFDFQYRDVPLASVTLDDPGLVARAREFTATVLKVLGLADSVFHMEAFHTPDDELVFLEIGNRFGGAGVPAQQRLVYGVDMAREAVLACTGAPSALSSDAQSMLDHPAVGASGWLFLPLAEKARCRVVHVSGADRLPESVVRAEIPAVGDELAAAGDPWPSAGRFVLSGRSTAAVADDMASIAANYAVTTTTGD